ncbi:MAG: hypothetical protein AAB971_04275 [Patescibacteria group bacterium]
MKNNKNSAPNYGLRRTLALGGILLAGLGVSKAIASAVDGLRPPSPSEITARFADTPKQTVTLGPGEGADDAIRKVEPRLLDGSDMSARIQVEQYIGNQGLGEGHVLQSGQDVSVPVLPKFAPDLKAQLKQP